MKDIKLQLFEIAYRISDKDYIDFNRLVLDNILKNKAKKSYLISAIMIAISIFLVIQVVVYKVYNQYLLLGLSVFLVFVSLYNILFYKKLYYMILKRNALKVYKSTRFSRGEINLKFFDDYILEYSSDEVVKIDLSSIEKIYKNQKLLVLISNIKHTLIIDRIVIDKDLSDFLVSKNLL